MALLDDYLGSAPQSDSATEEAPSLMDSYLGVQDAAEVAAKRTAASIKHTDTGKVQNLGAGVIQSLKDTYNSGMQIADYLHNKVFGEDEKSKAIQARIQKENSELPTDNTAFNVGRVLGQTAITAPVSELAPIRAAFGALPIAGKTAPFLNRLGATVTQGATAGASYGAGASSTNNEGLLPNVGKGAILGALVAPAIMGGEALANATVEGGKSAWRNLQINKLASASGLEPSAAKDIVARLEDAGFTPQTAQAALTKMGPKATIADLDEALTGETVGLSQLGGKPTSIVKERFKTRNAEANNETVDLMNNTLGPKPDIEAEKASIVNQARANTAPDYQAAYANTTPLDVSPVVKNIDHRLKVAVGKEATALKEVKGFLFRPGKDAQGNPIQEMKTDLPSLHAVRQGLDDLLERLPEEGTSAQSNTYRSISKVRNGIDEQLKTISEMQSADEKFAAKMKEKEGLQYGYDSFKKVNNIESFKKEFDNSTPEVQAAIKKGMHSAIGDMIDKAQRGEYAGAQQLLGKRSLNQQMVKHALGYPGETVLEGLKNEAAQRATEHAVAGGSRTAANTAVRIRREGGNTGEGQGVGGAFSEAAKALPFDFLGGQGMAAGASFVRKGGSNALIALSKNRLNALNEGAADLISRQGQSRDTALGVLNRVSAIQGQMKNPSMLRLPVSISAPVSQEGYKRYRGER